MRYAEYRDMRRYMVEINWAAWIPTIFTVMSVFYLAGQLTGRIKDQEKVITDHHNKLTAHDEELGRHSISIAEAKAWRSGYDAATGRKN
jgi:hypothetical protein